MCIYNLYNYGYIYVLTFGAYYHSSIKPSPTARATGTGGTHLAAGRSIRILGDPTSNKISAQKGDDRWEMVDDLEEKSKKNGKMLDHPIFGKIKDYPIFFKNYNSSVTLEEN